MINVFGKILFTFLLLILLCCKKDKVFPSYLPKGYYEINFKYDNGIDTKTEVVKFSESNAEMIIMHNLAHDTLLVKGEKISGNINIQTNNKYKINATWSYTEKEKKYIITGTFKHIIYPSGDGTFEMLKAE